MIKNSLILALFTGVFISAHAQWQNNSLLPAGNTIFGTAFNAPINVFTNNVNMARFTSSLALTTPWDFNGVFSGSGHGLSIQTSSTASGNLDLFTAQQGTTHIKFGGSGAISGQNSRMEYFAGGSGFYMNAVAGGFFKFTRGTDVTCRVGGNNFFGELDSKAI